MKIGIIGGGIGGLTLANAFESLDIEYHLFERAEAFGEVGAGIGLSESAIEIFDILGLKSKLLEEGKKARVAKIVDHKFKTIRSIPVDNGGICIERAKLISILSENLSPGNYSLNRSLLKFNDDDGTQVKLSFLQDIEQSFDLVIACDGINSAIRNQVYPKIKKRYAGQTVWRGIATCQLPEEFDKTYFEMWGNNLRFGVCPLGNDKYYWYAVKVVPAGEKDNPESLQNDLIETFRSYPPYVHEIIGWTSKIIRDDMWDLAPHKFSWHNGKIVFLGDAIHATTPNLAQGGCQAIEDAITLAKVIKKYGVDEKAIQVYEKSRRKRAEYVVNKSWQLGQFAHNKYPFFDTANKLLFKYLIPGSIFKSQYRKLNGISYLEQI